MKIPKIYKESDADLHFIKSRSIGVIGFGNQGRAQALNLKDSGIDVCVGVRKNGISSIKAKEDGFKVLDISETVKISDVIVLLVPDQDMGATTIEAY